VNTRWKHAAAALLVLPLGYALRFTPALPEWLRDASGGAAYVLFCAFAAATLWPRRSAARLALGALAFTCLVELAQLWHPAWLDALRRTLPGRLALGTTFAWSDFPPYATGAAIAYAVLRRVS